MVFSFLSHPILLCINVVFLVAIWPWLVMPPLPTFWTALTGLAPISCGNAAHHGVDYTPWIKSQKPRTSGHVSCGTPPWILLPYQWSKSITILCCYHLNKLQTFMSIKSLNQLRQDNLNLNFWLVVSRFSSSGPPENSWKFQALVVQ